MKLRTKQIMVLAMAMTMAMPLSMNAFAEDEVITAKIAVVGPMTGEQAEYGKQAKNAAEIAVEEWNEKDIQVDGKTVQFEVAVYDDAGKVDEAAALAEQIVNDDSIIAIANGHLSSSVALVACETYQQGGVLCISNAASHPDYAKIGEYVCRNNIDDEGVSKNCIQTIYRLGYKKVALVGQQDDFGVSAIGFGEDGIFEIQERGGEIEAVYSELIPATQDDYNSVISNVNGSGCDVCVNYGQYMEVAPFCIQAVKSGVNFDTHICDNALDDNLIKVGGEAVEGLYLPSLFNASSEDERVQEFVKKFEEHSGGTTPNHIGALCYDSTCDIMNIVEQTGSIDRKTLMEGAHSISYEGITGTIIFDDTNNCEKKQVCMKVENGEFVEVPGFLATWSDFLDEVENGTVAVASETEEG
jgi:branched-chain amino acid transport system substrate-binding protein